MLCDLYEKSRPKCHEYWHSSNKLKAFSVECSEEKELTSDLRMRTFLLTRNKDNESREIMHLHFVGWPDHGVPDVSKVQKSFDIMIQASEDNFTTSKNTAPIITHCSAGVGRTGTFISLYNLYHYIKIQAEDKTQEKIRFNVWNTVRKLKEQRRLLVENVNQYKFIYPFVATMLKTFKKKINLFV
jgi:protein-tyrosine phosphatase